MSYTLLNHGVIRNYHARICSVRLVIMLAVKVSVDGLPPFWRGTKPFHDGLSFFQAKFSVVLEQVFI